VLLNDTHAASLVERALFLISSPAFPFAVSRCRDELRVLARMAVPCRSACAAHSLEPPHHHAADALVLLMQYTAAAVYMRQLGTSTGQYLSMTIALRAGRRCRRSLVALDVLGAWFRTRRMLGVAHRLRRQRDLPNPVCCKPAFYLLETTRSRQSRVRCHANHSTASPRLGGGTSHRSGRGLRLAGSGTTFPVRSVSAVV
jgi:hypothetical protein